MKIDYSNLEIIRMFNKTCMREKENKEEKLCASTEIIENLDKL